MMVHIENPKESAKKVTELINKFSNVAAYKISIQNSVVFLHSSNEHVEAENATPFKITQNMIY